MRRCLVLLVALAGVTARGGSPEVHPDGSVTLHFSAPNAKSVQASIETLPASLPLARGADGVWSVTTGPLVPDYYSYTFLADGVRLIDPANPAIIPNLMNPASALHVPGPASLPWELRDVPHGAVTHQVYHSLVLGTESDYFVYTPPAYATSTQRYPVLYLLHGYTDGTSAWSAVGRAEVILDNLIADAKARPMIVVMPSGYGLPAIVQRESGTNWTDAAARALNFSRFKTILLKEILPRTEAGYRTLADPDHRAIAGLSMGGTESLLIGLTAPYAFSAVGSFSAGALPDDFAADFPQLGPEVSGRLRLLWIACGTADPRLALNRALRTWLDGRGVSHNDVESPGAHTWPVWRRNLADFAPLLFRD